MRDELFDKTDDLVVLFLGGPSDAETRKLLIAKLRAHIGDAVEQKLLPKTISLFYAFRNGESEGASKDSKAPALMLYKGQRKKLSSAINSEVSSKINSEVSSAINSEVSSEALNARGNLPANNTSTESVDAFLEAYVLPQLHAFFSPQSEASQAAENELLTQKALPTRVTYNTFQTEVLDAAKGGDRVLLQLYEDGCFLCFLMRPFINSVSKLLKAYEVPLVLKRLNLNTNDFPPQCPVTRATPTFVLYAPDQDGFDRWNEFRPKDFVAKLKQVRASPCQMPLGPLKMGVRDFDGLASYQSEGMVVDKATEDRRFEELVTLLMEEDMRRIDDLEESLQHLKREADGAQADCIALALMMGDELMRREVVFMGKRLLAAEVGGPLPQPAAIEERKRELLSADCTIEQLPEGGPRNDACVELKGTWGRQKKLLRHTLPPFPPTRPPMHSLKHLHGSSVPRIGSPCLRLLPQHGTAPPLIAQWRPFQLPDAQRRSRYFPPKRQIGGLWSVVCGTASLRRSHRALSYWKSHEAALLRLLQQQQQEAGHQLATGASWYNWNPPGILFASRRNLKRKIFPPEAHQWLNFDHEAPLTLWMLGSGTCGGPAFLLRVLQLHSNVNTIASFQDPHTLHAVFARAARCFGFVEGCTSSFPALRLLLAHPSLVPSLFATEGLLSEASIYVSLSSGNSSKTRGEGHTLLSFEFLRQLHSQWHSEVLFDFIDLGSSQASFSSTKSPGVQLREDDAWLQGLATPYSWLLEEEHGLGLDGGGGTVPSSTAAASGGREFQLASGASAQGVCYGSAFRETHVCGVIATTAFMGAVYMRDFAALNPTRSSVAFPLGNPAFMAELTYRYCSEGDREIEYPILYAAGRYLQVASSTTCAVWS
ncbi:thioredoxin-like protein [Cyclospora cayetanensis]|uniref:Thioredoxin-like protein n=1 Tax=Cyclospora cayetanensis TaxID=88456 RepID=A0A1D3D2N6_9EIME|nr:thioredoxin-like protein [Cyclospora cayetanensis]